MGARDPAFMSFTPPMLMSSTGTGASFSWFPLILMSLTECDRPCVASSFTVAAFVAAPPATLPPDLELPVQLFELALECEFALPEELLLGLETRATFCCCCCCVLRPTLTNGFVMDLERGFVRGAVLVLKGWWLWWLTLDSLLRWWSFWLVSRDGELATLPGTTEFDAEDPRLVSWFADWERMAWLLPSLSLRAIW